MSTLWRRASEHRFASRLADCGTADGADATNAETVRVLLLLNSSSMMVAGVRSSVKTFCVPVINRFN